MNEQPVDDGQRHLMIKGVLTVDDTPRDTCVIVERGMPVLSREGREIGKVAAVSVDGKKVVDAILLSRLPSQMEYLIIPTDLVTAVRDRAVSLAIGEDAIHSLEKRFGR